MEIKKLIHCYAWINMKIITCCSNASRLLCRRGILSFTFYIYFLQEAPPLSDVRGKDRIMKGSNLIMRSLWV